MTWTAPMTAVSGTVFTAAQWNTHVRDNLNACAPGVATTAGRWITSTGWHALAEREPLVQYFSVSETTDSTSFTDLDTVGPTIETVTSAKAFVSMGARIGNNTAGLGGKVGCAVSGASDLAEADGNAFCVESGNANDNFKGVWCTLFDDGMVAGLNQFQLKYRAVGGGIATFSDRCLVVISF